MSAPDHVPVRPPPRRDLAADCVREALAIIGDAGVEGLSLREVARRLGVSHQAPYKHYPSRDHLLAEVVRHVFADFAAHLDGSQPDATAREKLAAMGRAYIQYALAKPLHYRLMFATSLPSVAAHPEMMETAQHAFQLLVDSIAEVHRSAGQTPSEERNQKDALFVWSTMHGVATVLRSDALAATGVSQKVIDEATGYALGAVGAVLAASAPGTEG